jgi:hypothetical protein
MRAPHIGAIHEHFSNHAGIGAGCNIIKYFDSGEAKKIGRHDQRPCRTDDVVKNIEDNARNFAGQNWQTIGKTEQSAV